MEFIGLKEKKQKKTYFEENLNKLKKSKICNNRRLLSHLFKANITGDCKIENNALIDLNAIIVNNLKKIKSKFIKAKTLFK